MNGETLKKIKEFCDHILRADKCRNIREIIRETHDRKENIGKENCLGVTMVR